MKEGCYVKADKKLHRGIWSDPIFKASTAPYPIILNKEKTIEFQKFQRIILN